MEESYVLDYEELDIKVQEYLNNKGYKEGDQFEISAYTDDYDQTICIVLPVNK